MATTTTTTEVSNTSLHTQIAATSAAPIAPSTTPIQDLICIGFGPASLAIAIALHESLPATTPSGSTHRTPTVSFLERQPSFAWHAGMQLPGARMQISFLKDLATPRNPSSTFSFLSYLFAHHRLNHFINLSTFTPSRAEYEDYLRWCAARFEARGQVSYGQEVLSVAPDERSRDRNGRITLFRVVARDAATGLVSVRVARKVVVAVGGRAYVPAAFPASSSQVVHSSRYSTRVAAALPDATAPYHIVVIGAGQSAAEIFNDLPARYPNARVTMVIKGSALRPSDDSPFVNEIFDPDRVDGLFAQEEGRRARTIREDRATNYSVVRIDLLEHLYEKLYAQRRLLGADPRAWKVRVRTGLRVVEAEESDGGVLLRLESLDGDGKGREEMRADAVFVATGYVRNAHEEMLAETKGLLREVDRVKGGIPVTRDYKVAFEEGKVADDAGIWLQGCNEKTHGLSDTLLSILAVRGGELVKSMFGEAREAEELNLRAKL